MERQLKPAYAGRPRSPWLVPIGSGLAQTVGIGPLVLTTFSLFVVPIATDTGWKRSTIMVAFTVATVAFAAGTTIAGLLLDRYAFRVIVVPSWLLYGLSVAALFAVPLAVPMFYLPYFFVGVFAGGTFLPFSKAVLSWFDRRRGTAISVMAALGSLGALVTPILVGALIDGVGWRGAYPWMALAAVAVSLPIVLAFVRVRGERSVRGRLVRGTVDNGVRKSVEPPGLTLRQALTGRHFWMIAASMCMTGIAVVGIQINVVPLMIDQGMATREAALLLTTFGLASLLGRATGGVLLDRFHAPFVGAAACLCPAIGLLLLHPPFVSAVVGIALVGLAFGMEMDVLAFVISRYLGMRRIGALLGTIQSAVQLSIAFGPLLVSLGYQAAGDYAGLAPYIALVLVLSAATMLLLGRYRYPAVERPSEDAAMQKELEPDSP